MPFEMQLDGDFTMEELNEFWEFIIQREQERKEKERIEKKKERNKNS